MLKEIEVSSSEDSVRGDFPISNNEGNEDYLEEDLHVPNCDYNDSDTDDPLEQPQEKK